MNNEHNTASNEAIVSALRESIQRGAGKYGPYARIGEFDLKQLLAMGLSAMVEDAKAKLLLVQGVTALAAAAAAEKKGPPRVALSDTRVDTSAIQDAGLQLWHYVGSSDWYPNKLCAEMAARVQFPDESEDRRYSRIFCKTFVREE